MSLAEPRQTPLGRAPRWLRLAILGSCGWLIFLLLLEPGNILRAMDQGGTLAWDRELLRIAVASLMGGAATPLLLSLARLAPVGGERPWRAIAIQAAACSALAAGLILVATPLAAWLLKGDARSLLTGWRQDLTADWPLLTCFMGLVLAATQAARFLRTRSGPAADRPSVWLTRLSVVSRGRETLLDLAEVAWIETQGNYLALHAAGAVHLIRQTSTALEKRLDPDRFVRIHRRMIVALDRIQDLTVLDGGDAELRLKDGVMLRVSRNYRRALQARLRTST